MTSREFYLERRKAELPVFLRVLHAIPPGSIAYKPHERSPSAEQIVWTLINELRSCVEVVKENKTQWHQEPAPPLDEMLRQFEQLSNELTDRVAALDDASWDRIGHFYYNGKLVSEQPISQFLWFILFDGIHHRGQLSAYLRPMGGTVPSIYGPSADTRP